MLFDTRQQSRNLRSRNPIIDRQSLSTTGQDSTGLEQPQMFAALAGVQPTEGSDLMDGVFPLQQGVELS